MVQQLGFEGMPRRLYPCTPSRLRTWLDCPRRYRMTYLDRPAPPKGAPWAHNSLGASVHNALAGWWRLRREERTTEAAGELLESGWITEGYADDVQSAEYLRRSRTMVERYVARLDPACEPAGVERTVAAKTDLIAISGRIDRLDDRPAAELSRRCRGRRTRTRTAASLWSWTTRPAGVGCRPTTRGPRWRSRCMRLRPGGCCGGRAARWNCTTSRQGRCCAGSTALSRWSVSCAAPRTSPANARRPTSGTGPIRTPAAATRSSRRPRHVVQLV